MVCSIAARNRFTKPELRKDSGFFFELNPIYALEIRRESRNDKKAAGFVKEA